MANAKWDAGRSERLGLMQLVTVDRLGRHRRANQDRCLGSAIHAGHNGVDQTQANRLTGLCIDMGPVDAHVAGLAVQHERHITILGRFGRLDHQCAEQSARDLLLGALVRVVPVGASVACDELIRKCLARLHGVLRNAGDTVFRVRHAHAVPVHRGRLR